MPTNFTQDFFILVASFMFGLTSTSLLRVLNEVNDRGKIHQQLMDTLNSTRSMIIACHSEQYYDDLVEKCNDDYTKYCHDLMHESIPGDNYEDTAKADRWTGKNVCR